MADYKGNHCPVCNNEFKEGDDIVVCPDCGTPYHRACWAKVGLCVHEAEHAAGFEWKPEHSPEAELEAVCPNCGAHNPAGAKFCNHCGVPLGAETQADARPAPDPWHKSSAAGAPFTGQTDAPRYDASATQQTAGLFRREIGPEDAIDGIKAKDWASYLGRSSFYYLLQFVRLTETRRKVAVSFSAFFFGPLYFFYRKMWKEGAIFTALTLALAVPSALFLFKVSGSAAFAWVDSSWLVPLMNVAAVLDWAQMIFRSLFALYWYKKECTQNIQAICTTCPEGPQRDDALALRGGTSPAAVLIFLAAEIALGFALSFFMGPNLDAVLTALYL